MGFPNNSFLLPFTLFITSTSGITSIFKGLSSKGKQNISSTFLQSSEKINPLEKKINYPKIEKEVKKVQFSKTVTKPKQEDIKWEYLLFNKDGKQFCSRGGGDWDPRTGKKIECSKYWMKEYLGNEQSYKLWIKIKYQNDLNSWANSFLRIVWVREVLLDKKSSINFGSFSDLCSFSNKYVNNSEELGSEGWIISCSKENTQN